LSLFRDDFRVSGYPQRRYGFEELGFESDGSLSLDPNKRGWAMRNPAVFQVEPAPRELLLRTHD